MAKKEYMYECLKTTCFVPWTIFTRVFLERTVISCYILLLYTLNLNFICSWNSYSVRDLSCPGPPSLCAKTSSRAVHRCSPRLSPILAASTSHRKKNTQSRGKLGFDCVVFLATRWGLPIQCLYLAILDSTVSPWHMKSIRSPWWKTTSALVAIDISSLWLGDGRGLGWTLPILGYIGMTRLESWNTTNVLCGNGNWHGIDMECCIISPYCIPGRRSRVSRV